MRYYAIKMIFLSFCSLPLCFAEFFLKTPAVIKLNTKKGMQLGVFSVHHFEICYRNYMGSKSMQVRQKDGQF